MQTDYYSLSCLKRTFRAFLWLGLTGILASCSSEETLDTANHASVRFELALNAESRAARPLNPQAYDTRLYLYERREAEGKVGYTQVDEQQVTANNLILTDLIPQKQYKAVFLAVPNGQQPALPELFRQGTVPTYDQASATYNNGKTAESTHEIFRSIVDFKATAASIQQQAVLSRQNGALEVRLLNQTGLTKVELHVMGHTAYYLNDGTGGQVITKGNTCPFVEIVEDPKVLEADVVAIRIHLLPQEDLTDLSGTNNYLKVTTTVEKTYPIKSDQKFIPIYPNQVTWLTLGSRENTNFDVSFSGNINLDDPQWDGFQ